MRSTNKVGSTALINKLSSSNREWIVITVTNSYNKNELCMIDTTDQMKQKLVSNRNTMTTGKVNATGDILLYSNAIENN